MKYKLTPECVKSTKTVTPEEFAEEMREIIKRNTKFNPYAGSVGLDLEDCHWDMDKLMMFVLCQLGYGEGIDIFANTKKWYA